MGRKKVKIRKVFLEDLPRWGKGGKAKQGSINWRASVGYKVRFIFDDFNGEIEIINYERNAKSSYIIIKYENNNGFKISPSDFLQCKLQVFLGLQTKKHRYNINEIIENKTSKIKILKQIRIINNSKIKSKGYEYECLTCGNVDTILEGHIKEGKGCNVCCTGSKKALKGYNDISTTHPHFVKYFVDVNDAFKYTYGSTKDVYLKCPNCNHIKFMCASKLIENGFSCPKCGDGISYPEKVMFSVLDQLNIEFKTQKIFKWSNNKKYDFYIPSLNMIIETHGIQHYKENHRTGRKSLKEEQKNDITKVQLAKDNDIKRYIVIDCRKSELEFIKNNILNSDLFKLFDLSNIDWIKTEEFALSNRVKEACDIKTNNPDLTTTKIGEIMKLCGVTIAKYLKQGTDLGWCNYNPKEESFKVHSKMGKSKGKIIEVFKDGISLGIFPSCLELARQSKKLFDISFNTDGISSVCHGRQSNHKGFTFKFV